MTYDTATMAQESFAEWLETFSFRSFCTLTYRDARRRNPLDNFGVIERLLQRLGQGGCRQFVAAEYGSAYGRVHLHALIEHNGRCGRAIKRAWEHTYGIARISPYDPRRRAIGYVCKYVLKDSAGTGDYDLYTTSDKRTVERQFEHKTQVTGYQLYLREMEKGREHGLFQQSPEGRRRSRRGRDQPSGDHRQAFQWGY